jgi:hypothetical protein
MSEEAEIERLDKDVDYLEGELKRMTEQAEHFRDLARSHAGLLLQAAVLLEKRCIPRELSESQLIAELHEAAKDE